MHTTLATFAGLAAMLAIAHAQPARDDLWREDIQRAVDFVTARHPGLFTNVSSERFDEARAALLASVPQRSDAGVLLGLQQLLALARDGHTNLSVLQARTPLRRLPLRFQWFSDGIFVTSASAAHISALGARVVRVEDLPVEEAVSRLAPFISHENEWWVRSQAPLLMSSPEALFAAGILPGESAPVRITVERAGVASTITATVAAAALFSMPHKARPNPPLYTRLPERFYWFEYLEPSRTVYIKYNSCQNSPVLPMAAFVAEIGAILASAPVERAVLDLRNNGGGDSSVIAPLTAATVDALRAGVLSRERLFVIIGRDTYSSGLWAAIDFKRLGATLVGEPTGNSPNHFGNVVQFTLPNSGFVLNCSTRWWSFPDFPGDTLPPDIAAPLSSDDFFDERDPALAAVLR